MKLLPCCGKQPNFTESYGGHWVCTVCGLDGPADDPDGSYWNSLDHKPPSTPEGTVRVRIAAEIDEKGNWCATGWSNASDEDMKGAVATMEITDDTRVTAFITADLPLPKPVEVQGVAE